MTGTALGAERKQSAALEVFDDADVGLLLQQVWEASSGCGG